MTSSELIALRVSEYWPVAALIATVSPHPALLRYVATTLSHALPNEHSSVFCGCSAILLAVYIRSNDRIAFVGDQAPGRRVHDAVREPSGWGSSKAILKFLGACARTSTWSGAAVAAGASSESRISAVKYAPPTAIAQTAAIAPVIFSQSRWREGWGSCSSAVAP